MTRAPAVQCLNASPKLFCDICGAAWGTLVLSQRRPGSHADHREVWTLRSVIGNAAQMFSLSRFSFVSSPRLLPLMDGHVTRGGFVGVVTDPEFIARPLGSASEGFVYKGTACKFKHTMIITSSLTLQTHFNIFDANIPNVKLGWRICACGHTSQQKLLLPVVFFFCSCDCCCSV